MIPANVIEDIKARNDVEDVISAYVTLKKSGKNVKGLCPFHSEKSASFTVFPDTQSFYCFGCGAGGDVISFIMRQENLDYVSAVDFLAKRVGITLPSFDGKPEKTGPGRAKILQMNTEAAKFFRDMLFDDKIGAPARDYLINKRKLSSAVIRRFGLGYAPDGFRYLREHMQKLGFSNDDLFAAYLCGKNERGYYDIFRDRVIFPIIDVSGNVIAFGGRAMNDRVKPKYLHTSDTVAFKKGKNLYALNFAKNSSSGTMIVCEGYMDAIAIHSAGIDSAVATLGTAITPDNARLIKKYTDKVILSYDSDEPGQIAADRAVKILAEAGVDSRILVIDGAKDPDEYIKKYGVDMFRKLLEGSRSKFDFFLEKLKNKYDLSSSDSKIKAASETCSYIAGIYSKVERDIYISKASKLLEIERNSLEIDVDNMMRRNRRAEKKKQTTELIRETSGMKDRVNPQYVRSPGSSHNEENVLGMILTYPDLLRVDVDGSTVCEDDFSTDLNIRLFRFIKESCENGSFNIGLLSSEFSPDEVSRAMRMQIMRRDVSNTSETFAVYVRALREEKTVLDDSGSLEDLLNRKKQNISK